MIRIHPNVLLFAVNLPLSPQFCQFTLLPVVSLNVRYLFLLPDFLMYAESHPFFLPNVLSCAGFPLYSSGNQRLSENHSVEEHEIAENSACNGGRASSSPCSSSEILLFRPGNFRLLGLVTPWTSAFDRSRTSVAIYFRQLSKNQTALMSSVQEYKPIHNAAFAYKACPG